MCCVERQCQTWRRLRTNIWVFHFGDNLHLTVTSVWLILSQRILLTRDDDGQKFGLKTSIDAEAKARQLLTVRRVKSVDVNPVSADLRFRFDGEVVLETVNESSGYECWILNHNDGSLWVGRNE